MDVYEAFEATKQLANGLPTLFRDARIEFVFGSDRPAIGNWSNPDNLGLLVSGDGIGSMSGIYFFSTPTGQVIYIGKATKNNLHQRVWGHLRTPAEQHGATRTFPNHGFKDRPEAFESIAYVMSGSARLAVIAVSEPALVSLIEVYLQTLHIKKYERLPSLNRQIG